MAGIYIHIPFCKQACFYCDFHFSTSLKKKQDLIYALKKELKLRKNELLNYNIETIYFGGGTPSLLTYGEITELLNVVYKNYNVTANPEITLEANPDDLSENVIIELSKSPVNRLSIGIQSFFDTDLKQMNRAHHAKDSKTCLEIANKYFDNISIDLIYGIPNMSLAKWEANLEQAFRFGVNHISSYALTVEPKTALASFVKQGVYPPTDEALALQHFKALISKTKAQGFIHYEISNFGKSDYFSKHNTSYWKGKPYLGVGPSAHSFSGTTRSWNVSNNSKYIKAINTGVLPKTEEQLSKKDQFNEYVMTGLRTIWGVSLDRVEHHFTANAIEHLKSTSQKFIDKGLLVISEEPIKFQKKTKSLKITEKGKFLVDGIASELFMI